jgi:hypothetical protein
MGKEFCSLTTQTPYSYLIYQALLTAPEMKMPLQRIYAWFEENTTKCQQRDKKGWQTSIRYNLSINAVGAYPDRIRPIYTPPGQN